MLNLTDETTIYLYGEIGSDNGITDKDYVSQLDTLPVNTKKINLRINTPGGDIFQGYAIYNLIKASKVPVDCYVDGIASSMGSIIALAGQKTYMCQNSMFMIHNPASKIEGTSDEMINQANILDKIKNQVVSIYCDKTGLSANVITDMMNKTTWLNAEEALNLKFIDEIVPDVLSINSSAAEFKNLMPLEAFNKINTCNLNKSIIMNDKMILKALQLTDNATMTDVQEKIIALIEENRTLKERFKTSEDKAIDDLVNNAIFNKKITFAQKEAFINLAKKDFETTSQVLKSLPEYKSLMHFIKESNDQENKKKNKTDKPRSEWTLTDYRKFDPKALQNDELYNRLIKEEK
ncbi:MAG: Clp protease ClpP [Bacteroidia bacterium]|nr:Clp protease ClpP [Bacteroidia bacterium]